MRKIALLLVCILCLSGVGAYAEIAAGLENIEISPIEGIANEIEADFGFDINNAVLDGNEGKFTVNITEEAVQVEFGSIRLSLSSVSGSGLTCCTPNFFASINEYMIFDDPRGIHEIVVENDIAMLIVDSFSGDIALVYPQEPDQLSELVGDFNLLSDTDLGYIVQAIGGDTEDIYKTESACWILSGDTALTIVESQYIVFEFTSDVKEDITFILDELVIERI